MKLLACKCMTFYKKLHFNAKSKPPYVVNTLLDETCTSIICTHGISNVTHKLGQV